MRHDNSGEDGGEDTLWFGAQTVTSLPDAPPAGGVDTDPGPTPLHVATGVVRHPLTLRYQPWVWSEDVTETTIVYLRSYVAYEDAAWIARQYADAWRRYSGGSRAVLDRLAERLRLGDVPDPLPPATEAALLAAITTRSLSPQGSSPKTSLPPAHEPAREPARDEGRPGE